MNDQETDQKTPNAHLVNGPHYPETLSSKERPRVWRPDATTGLSRKHASVARITYADNTIGHLHRPQAVRSG